MIRPQSRDLDKRPYFDFDLRGIEGGEQKYQMLKDRVHGVREVSISLSDSLAHSLTHT
jgi:hypothetical protein